MTTGAMAEERLNGNDRVISARKLGSLLQAHMLNGAGS
jgi:hypothetical protein